MKLAIWIKRGGIDSQGRGFHSTDYDNALRIDAFVAQAVRGAYDRASIADQAACNSISRKVASEARDAAIRDAAQWIRGAKGGWPTGAGDSDEWTLDDVANELLRALISPSG